MFAKYHTYAYFLRDKVHYMKCTFNYVTRHFSPSSFPCAIKMNIMYINIVSTGLLIRPFNLVVLDNLFQSLTNLDTLYFSISSSKCCYKRIIIYTQIERERERELKREKECMIKAAESKTPCTPFQPLESTLLFSVRFSLSKVRKSPTYT